MKNIFVLNSVIRLIERNTAHAIRFARIGAALLLIAVGTLVFGACVLLTGTPLVVLFTAFVICSFIGSQLFGGAILVMEEDRRNSRRDGANGNENVKCARSVQVRSVQRALHAHPAPGYGHHGSGAPVQTRMLVRPLVHRIGLASARVLDGFRMPVRRAAEHPPRI